MRKLQRTWAVGGICLIACGVIGMLRLGGSGAPDGSQFLGLAADVFYAVGVCLLALGLTRDASVVARRPLGVGAMLLVAVWPLLSDATTGWLGLVDPYGRGAAWTVFGYLSLVVPVGAGLIAATQIARAGVVQAPWKYAPLWVVGLHALTWAVPQLAVAAAGPGNVQIYADLFVMLGALAFLAGTLGLGVVAIVLAARRRPASVDVFRSA